MKRASSHQYIGATICPLLPVTLFILIFRPLRLSDRSGFSALLGWLSCRSSYSKRSGRSYHFKKNEKRFEKLTAPRLLFQKYPIRYDVLGRNGNMTNKRRRQKILESLLYCTYSQP
jgi:hypothetical protein